MFGTKKKETEEVVKAADPAGQVAANAAQAAQRAAERADAAAPVSYTHLDVYKRQTRMRTM